MLLQKVKDPGIRDWYIKKDVDAGWSRAVLWHQIDTRLHERQGIDSQSSNFSRLLPTEQSELAIDTFKDPYLFDFLTLSEAAKEKELENALIHHLERFLLELGVGFSFVGRQYALTVGDQDIFLDRLFYHLKLRCFVIVELKAKEFKPEYAGKMGFYLSAVDAQLKHPTDEPSIGLILCKTKDNVVVEYTLRDSNKPIGVSTYQLLQAMPKEFQSSLPTIEQLEAELVQAEDSQHKGDA